MINFNKDSIFNLHPIDLDKVHDEARGLLIEGEEMVAAFKTVRDQLVFTNKRIISIDVQGITGMRRSFSSMPYSKAQFFGIQTTGFLEIVPDAELMLTFANGTQACFDFRGNVDIGQLGRVISEYVLNDRS
ncbi:MAG: PH domain-containing protein [Clostridia bacterium]|nr:PH domain-containing protein [Clostridia bacterium]